MRYCVRLVSLVSEFDLLVKEKPAALEGSRSEPQTVAAEAAKAKNNAPYKKGDIRYSETLDDSIAGCIRRRL